MKHSPRRRSTSSWLHVALAFLPSLLIAQPATTPPAPLQYVDPWIGSAHCRWFFFTPAATPFGMAKPSPCTDAHLGNRSGWEAVGYDGRHTSIEGFAQFREFQIGGVVLMPTTGTLVTTPGTDDNPDAGYRSRFDRHEEIAQPGYYQVKLKDYNILAELTSTPRVALHRYTFPTNETGHVLFQIGSRQGESGPVLDAFVHQSAERELEGMVTTLPEYVRQYQPGANVRMYFVAQLSHAPSKWSTFRNDELYAGQSSIAGPGAGLALDFKPDDRAGDPVVIKIGLSYTSIANARLNLATEAKNLSFNAAKAAAQKQWAEMLDRIHVEGGKESDRVKFYTGLYHALLGRGLASDVNGAYPKNDGGTGQIPCDQAGRPLYHHYNSDAVWGTFWNLTQLWALAYPDYFSEYVRCHLDHYRDCGWLPDSIATAKFVSGVGTDYMGLVVASAYLRGIRDFDPEIALQAALKNELGWQNRPLGVGKADLQSFLKLGYSPLLKSVPGFSGSTAEGSQFSVSHTLEYSFSAYAVSQLAASLGHTTEARQLQELSSAWQQLWDPESGFIRPKDADGVFLEDFNPRKPWLGYQEGNAWQYTFYVPHDPAGLIQRLGTPTFNTRLEDVFKQAEQTLFGGGRAVDAFSGVENVYNHGNQPSLHIAWLFNYGGQPWRTQHWVRRICDVFYGTEILHGYGFGQDEDQGQLGAWFVLAAMGLFDVQGLTSTHATLQLATPLFDHIRIQLHPNYYPGGQFTITTRNQNHANPYIQNAQLNGNTLEQCWIPWNTITAGGRLELDLGNQPNTDWGLQQPPPSGFPGNL